MISFGIEIGMVVRYASPLSVCILNYHYFGNEAREDDSKFHSTAVSLQDSRVAELIEPTIFVKDRTCA